MEEAAESSLEAYPTFSAFFNRSLKEGIRPIEEGLVVGMANNKGMEIIHFPGLSRRRDNFALR